MSCQFQRYLHGSASGSRHTVVCVAKRVQHLMRYLIPPYKVTGYTGYCIENHELGELHFSKHLLQAVGTHPSGPGKYFVVPLGIHDALVCFLQLTFSLFLGTV